ncbi:hypothetical protein F8388_004133 [Cannabis sativa]|uniref:Uncharacterized protein n=1 Tax=Cannabis sativa TaxID=3483 RepID=A0A7J6EBM5_CANSA|nr:hypothetical protein F8388_004133 [Cannabis sativa]
MGSRRACCENMGLRKGPWTPEEDHILISYIQQFGHANWRALPKQAGLLRCGKSCRLRWINYLRPDIKRGNFSKEEEDTIIKLHHNLGNRWSSIATQLPGRTDNEIKNFWHTHLKKKIKKKLIMKQSSNSETDHLDHEAILQPMTMMMMVNNARTSSSNTTTVVNNNVHHQQHHYYKHSTTRTVFFDPKLQISSSLLLNSDDVHHSFMDHNNNYNTDEDDVMEEGIHNFWYKLLVKSAETATAAASVPPALANFG